MNVRKFFAIMALILSAAAPRLQGQVHSSSSYAYLLDEAGTRSHIDFLTSPRIAGRAAGTPQAREVAEYIAAQMESYGLQPFRSVSFFQPFNLPAIGGVQGAASGSKAGSGNVGAGNLSGSGYSYTDAYRRATGGAVRETDVRKGYNVVGYLPAARKDAGYIVIGAHFDHIGSLGERFYPGADDNASGVAALLELAQAFAQRYREKGDLGHNIVFVAFDGNNYSLLGSTHFVSRCGIPYEKITCMINLDQMGSTLAAPGETPEYLLVLGADKLQPWQKEQMDFANSFFSLGLHLDYTYYGSPEFYNIFYKLSDQHSFTAAGIPALLFTSGITGHTNKESDVVANLDMPVIQKRIELIYRFLWLIL